MITKLVSSARESVEDIKDGATIFIGGFGRVGQPIELIDALIEKRVKNLTVINNNAGNGESGLAALIGSGQVGKVVCSFPRQSDSYLFDQKYRAGDIELELVPQGTLAERIRAAGAGLGGFFTPTGVDTVLAIGKETRQINGKTYIFELPLAADFALISAYKADRWGNLVYRKTSRNFGPIMATAASKTIVQVDEVVPLGNLDPEVIVTPGIYVDRLVVIGERAWLHTGNFIGIRGSE